MLNNIRERIDDGEDRREDERMTTQPIFKYNSQMRIDVCRHCSYIHLLREYITILRVHINPI